MMQELMRIDDAGKISFVESILIADEIKYAIADTLGGAEFAVQARILVHKDDFDRSVELLIDAGLKHDLYPLKKSEAPGDN